MPPRRSMAGNRFIVSPLAASPSQALSRQLSQRESPWQYGKVSVFDGEGKPAYNSLNAFKIRSPVSPLFSGWNWVPYTLPALTTPVTGME